MESQLIAQVKEYCDAFLSLKAHVNDLKNMAINLSSRTELIEKWATNSRYSPYPKGIGSTMAPTVMRESFQLLKQQSNQRQQLEQRILRDGNFEETVMRTAIASLKGTINAASVAQSSSPTPLDDAPTSSATCMPKVAQKRKYVTTTEGLLSEEDRDVAALALAAFSQLKVHIEQKQQTLELKLNKIENESKARGEWQMRQLMKSMEASFKLQIMSMEQRLDRKWSALIGKEKERAQRIATQAATVIGGLIAERGGKGKEKQCSGVMWSDKCNWCLDAGNVCFGSSNCGHAFVCAQCSIAIAGSDQPKCLTCFSESTEFVYLGMEKYHNK